MRLIKENLKLCLLLYVFWIVLTMDFRFTSLVIGLSISIIVTIGSYGILHDKYGFKVTLPKIFNIIKFTLRLMFEIYKSSFSYIVRIIKKDCDPIFVNIELNTNNPLIITMISNAITLTPGTLTVDKNRNKLVVLSIDDPKKRGKCLAEEIIKKYEKLF
ncbi:Na+/H+ antiporter subunit E [Caldisalinibacter kiritimatiensis]|uniref:Na(+) H(+) antiporter subunit E n=1 Tax=Caldisalinibacter kiritimatiensis TaxID=1304284 RepID=R1AXD7_9FIRM|nr:Na+/H+ antiporter subunit E [Caldisalinibacter kiritimatiensis]EOD01863.1 hypothetical protein L21TH_0049 [Caldisalinibacter kiritimatiensis]